jgi:hypothetical protein
MKEQRNDIRPISIAIQGYIPESIHGFRNNKINGICRTASIPIAIQRNRKSTMYTSSVCVRVKVHIEQ